MSREGRIVTTKERRVVTIRINAPKNWFLLLIGPVWLTLWTIGGISAFYALIIGNGSRLFYVYWLCIWVVIEICVLLAFLWTLFGKEIISIQDGSLEYARLIFGLGLRRKFALKQLSRLQAQGPFPKINSIKSSFRQGTFDPTVSFQVEPEKTYRFGLNLSEDEAKALVAELTPYIDSTKRPGLFAQPKPDW